jgi:hypothetical protein
MPGDEISRWFYKKRADEATKSLIKHGFEAINVDTAFL